MPDPAATSAAGLVERLVAGERRALAEVITQLERLGPKAPELLQHLAPHVGRARLIGITGPPGAGKSTLVNALIAHWRKSGERVAVIAVDPSSPVSGGAILGDRVRMTAALDDDGVFVRSLASQGHLGGLSPAAVRIVDAIDAAGFGLILIETVGTGQTEIDVAEVADIRVVVAAPGLGDGIQAMKSGVLEIADVLVVNKADREGAERTRHELMAALRLRANGGDVAVLDTVATTSQGIDALASAISQRMTAPAPGRDAAIDRRRARARYLLLRAAHGLVAERLAAVGEAGLKRLADRVLAGELTADAAARQLVLDGSVP